MMGAAGHGPCTTSGGNHADPARNRRGTAACRRLHLRPDGGAAGYFGAHRDQPHQERVPQARRAFRRGSGHARGATAPARGRSIMTPADYVINLTLSVILIVGAYQFYFWCQRNHMTAARELGSRIAAPLYAHRNELHAAGSADGVLRPLSGDHSAALARVLTAFHLQPQLGQLALAFPALIALSCLFTKQHYLLDLPAGALLGWLTYWGYGLAAPA